MRRVVALALVLLTLRAPAIVAQRSASAARCAETRRSLSAPLVSTAIVEASWTASGATVRGSGESRVDALVAGAQCMDADLADLSLGLRREAALTRDLLGAHQLEPPGNAAGGLLLRARSSSRLATSGRHATAHDFALGAWRRLGPLTLTSYVQDVEAPVSRARIVSGASPPPGGDLWCDTACTGTPPTPSPTPSVVIDSSARHASRRVREVVVRASTSWRRFAFDVTAANGVSGIEGPRRWLLGEAAMPIRSRVDFVVLGRASSRAVSPSRHELGAVLRYHVGRATISSAATVGDEGAAVALRAEETGATNVYRIVVRAERASRVRIRADFTSWQAVPLTRSSEGEWEAVLGAEPGLHRILLSIDDDEWAAPPGLPVVPDGFGTDVGVLRLPGSRGQSR